MEFLKAALLGIVEGVTEFIPVSSTGHLIVAGNLLNFEGPRAATFEIFIQLGAIFAVLFIYKERFYGLADLKLNEGFKGRRGLGLLALSTLPALFFGALAHGTIKARLFNPASVAVGLAAGGIFMLAVEQFLPETKKAALDLITPREAFLIGLFQCLALWPGMSRSACTIAGAMLLGIERKAAAEFSFFAAVPIIFAATVLDVYKNRAILGAGDLALFSLGFAVAFAAAWLSIKFFIRVLASHTLRPFGWYRIAVAPLIYWFIP